MRFPLWQYLNQPLWNSNRPAIFNPIQYWRSYQRIYLDRCLQNAFLEQCWDTNYQQFVTQYHDFCDREPLEEDPHWLAERSWQAEFNLRTYEHPENSISEPEH